MRRILLLDSFEQTRNSMEAALAQLCELTCTATEKDFQVEIATNQHDLVFLDIDDSAIDSMNLLSSLITKNPYLPIIITSQTEKAETIVRAMNNGASDFLVHPVSTTRVRVAVDKALELRDTRLEIAYHRRTQDVVYNFSDVIANSHVMQEVLVKLERFAGTDSTILITGDTGTGKSFLSGTVHFNSPRRSKPFVKINCANIPESLLESELFGHERGAFTGADKQRVGRFEQASGGTIFLDEIGEMALGLQTKLLRVLEEKEFERVGGNKTIQVDVRIIAATNKNLQEQVSKGLFREDLYYRINVLPVRLPPLRERRECLLPLSRLLLGKSCRNLHRNIEEFSTASAEKIKGYGWPGNIRQLANTIERAVILEDDSIIHQENLFLPEEDRNKTESTECQTGPDGMVESAGTPERTDAQDQACLLADQERQLILQALEECLWVQKSAANKLGISPRSLNYKISKLGIKHPHWRRNS